MVACGIPTQSGRGFRFDPGYRSDLMSAPFQDEAGRLSRFSVLFVCSPQVSNRSTPPRRSSTVISVAWSVLSSPAFRSPHPTAIVSRPSPPVSDCPGSWLRATPRRRPISRALTAAPLGCHRFCKTLEPCLVGMEACATAHYWARKLIVLGHEVKLMVRTRMPGCVGGTTPRGVRLSRSIPPESRSPGIRISP